MLKFRLVGGLFAVLCFGLAAVKAAEPSQSATSERRVELFAAAAKGEIDVELIAPSAREVWLRVANQTDQPLRIDLPDAFAAVPVLAQFAPGGFGGGGFGGGNFGGGGFGLPGMGGGNFGGGGLGGGGFAGGGGQGQGGQGLGGGFNNNNFGGGIGAGNMLGNGVGGGNQFGNGAPFRQGIFRVAAGRVGKIRAAAVCLEHGKPEPNSRMHYRIVPIQEFQSDPRIARICQLLASGEVSQNVAQAAAWHVANGLTWEELAAQDRSRSQYTGNEKFFTRDELELAMRVARAIEPAATSTRLMQTTSLSAK
jgi:hypothetical protein